MQSRSPHWNLPNVNLFYIYVSDIYLQISDVSIETDDHQNYTFEIMEHTYIPIFNLQIRTAYDDSWRNDALFLFI